MEKLLKMIEEIWTRVKEVVDILGSYSEIINNNQDRIIKLEKKINQLESKWN
jgi:hypothetical protein